jgi:CBS domain-containing protein
VSRSDVVRGLCVERAEAEYLSAYYLDLSGFEASPPEDLAAIAARVGERIEHKTVREVMSRNLITVAPGDPLSEVARTLVERRIHRLPVTEGEVLVGIVTSLDFARLFADGRVKAL